MSHDQNESDRLWSEGLDGLGARVKALEERMVIVETAAGVSRRPVASIESTETTPDQGETAKLNGGALESKTRGSSE